MDADVGAEDGTGGAGAGGGTTGAGAGAGGTAGAGDEVGAVVKMAGAVSASSFLFK